MPKIAPLIAAAVLTAITAGAARAEPYQADHLVRAVVSNRIAQAFGDNDPEVRLIRASYLSGFSLAYDSRCNFLPQATFDQIRAIVDEAKRNGANDGTGEAAEIGFRDAGRFIAQHGCNGPEAGGARASLTRFWDGAMRAMGSERQASSEPEAPQPRRRL
jgi:hypothetical protein